MSEATVTATAETATETQPDPNKIEFGPKTDYPTFRAAWVAAGGRLTLPIRRSHKTGRNEPCHCGSGKKTKHCCKN